jgi:hypothetical protein
MLDITCMVALQVRGANLPATKNWNQQPILRKTA